MLLVHITVARAELMVQHLQVEHMVVVVLTMVQVLKAQLGSCGLQQQGVIQLH
jgi:hypothetical protein